ncbi:MAG: hypothetical protein EOP51_12610, partial [Sphingobacteriales bacterium]
MKKNVPVYLILLSSIFLFISNRSQAQAMLPVYNTDATIDQVGWTYGGVNAVAGNYDCGGSNVIRFNGIGDYAQVRYNANATNVSFIIRRSSDANKKLVVEQSVTGTAGSWSTVGTIDESNIGPDGSEHPFTYPVLAASRYIRLRMSERTSGNLTVDAISVYNTTAPPCIACQPYFSSNNDEWITNVSFGGINNTTGSTNGGYANYTTSVGCGSITIGSAYTLSVSIKADYDEYVYAWIDWNRDGVFNNTLASSGGERYTLASNTSSNGPFTQSITAPPGALTGNTRMRVMVDWRGTSAQSCRVAEYGEAEDYCINVIGCKAPTGATITQETNIANTSVTSINICQGSRIVLKQTGGILGPGQTWHWYSGSCGGTPVGTSTNADAELLVTTAPPVGTTTYYVRAQGGGCGTGTCYAVANAVQAIVRQPGTVTLSSGTQNIASACRGAAITPIVFTVGGGATGANISWSPSQPTGINYNSGTYTISGTPTGATGTYTYTLSATGSNLPCTNQELQGTITVKDKPSFNYSLTTFVFCTNSDNATPPATISNGGEAPVFSISPTISGITINASTGQINVFSGTTIPSAVYTVTATNTCGSTTQNVTIEVSSGNQVFNMTPATGTETICSNSTGLQIGLNGAQNGMLYNLYRGATLVGTHTASGTAAFNFTGLYNTAGIYRVVAMSGCATNMNGSLTINVTAQPTTNFTYPSYNFCRTGVSPGATFSGSPVSGIFSATPAGLNFINTTTGVIDLQNSNDGTYTLSYKISASGGCSEYIVTRQITIMSTPTFYDVTGGGAYCSGGSGLPVGLSNSQSGISYQLFRNGTPLGAAITSPGGILNFGNQTLAGTYTVKATLGSCVQDMNYEAIISVNPAPADIIVTPANSTICLGASVALSASGAPPAPTPGSITLNSGTINMSIPDNDPEGIFNTIRMTGIPTGATITGVSVKLNIQHDYDQDLRIHLKGPNGNVLNLANQIGNNNDDFINTVLTSNPAFLNINGFNPPFTGTYAPQATMNIPGATAINNNTSNVNQFFGLFGSTSASANGNWTLSVRDLNYRFLTNDEGSLLNWEITINYTVLGNPASVVWTPASGLYTDPGTSNAYIPGAEISTVYAKPTTVGTHNYLATITTDEGCSKTANAVVNVNPSPVILVTADYCTYSSTNIVRITATSNVPINTWTWSGGYTSINTSTTSYIDVTNAGTFYVSAVSSTYSCPGAGQASVAQELVLNGDFEGGNTGFTSDYTYVNNTIEGGLQPAGTYTVNSNPNFNHDDFWGIDHTYANGEGNYMLLNGRNTGVVWKQTVNVLPNTEYYFSAWAVSLNSAGNYANLVFYVNGSPVGVPTGALPSKAANNNSGTWIRFYGKWNSNAISGPVEIHIVNTQTNGSGNDFGIDDVSFATLSSFFNLTSAAGTDNQTTLCQNSEIVDIEYEVGGDGAAPQLTAGALPAGLQTFWNGRTFRIYGTPTAAGSFNYTYTINVGSLCGPKSKSGTININAASYAGTPAATTLSSCYSGTVNLAANLTGTIGTLTWHSSPSGNAGTFSPIASPTLTNVTSAAYYMAIAQNTAACQKDTSDIVLVGVKNLWTGKQNADLVNPQNWSDAQLPSFAVCPDVIIPNTMPAKPLPILNGSTSAINNLVIHSGANVTIVNNGTLQIAGSINNANASGGINANDGIIEMTGANQNLSGIWFTGKNIEHLKISGGLLTINGTGDTLNILEALSFGNTTADLVTNDNITLKSDATKTASVGKVDNQNVITGKFNIERYLKAYRGWRFLAAPIKGGVGSPTITQAWRENGANPNPGYGTQITGPNPISTNGFDQVTTTPGIKWYQSSSNTYINVTNTHTSIAKPEGYMVFVRGDRTVVANGTPTATNLRIKGEILTGTQNYNVGGNAFISVGNPYPSAIDAAMLLDDNVNPALTQSYLAWDPSSGPVLGNGVGIYQNISPDFEWEPSAGGTPLYPLNQEYRYIQSGQAVFLRNTLPSAAGFTITEAMKVNEVPTSAMSRGGNANRSFIRVKLMNLNSEIIDGNAVAFDNVLSSLVDDKDVLKFTNSGENFGILRANKNLAMEARSPVVSTDTIFYNMSNLKVANYKLAIAPKNFNDPLLTAYMVDKFLGTTTPVSITDSTFIQFASTSAAASRAADRSVAVSWKVTDEINMLKYEVERSANGADFESILTTAPTAVNGGSASYVQTDLSPLAADNFYRIKAISLDGQVQYSAIVKVGALRNTAAVIA